MQTYFPKKITAEISRLHLVKKIQRSFVIEYKSGRRKTDPKSNSIWGNMDLKSVARDVEDEALPFPRPDVKVQASASEVSLPNVNWKDPLLTQSDARPTTATATQEATMADENNSTISNDAPTSVVASIDAPKKQRKPRAKKAAPEAAAVETAAEPAAAAKRGKQVRGRKPKSSEAAVTVKSAPVKRAAKAARVPAAAAPVAAIDDIADLLQLEEENQRLRKLLTEKLRAENADLRKRLNLG